MPSRVIFARVVDHYISLGIFLDIISTVVLVIPTGNYLELAMGWNSMWFGVIMFILIEMGLVILPVGKDAFILA